MMSRLCLLLCSVLFSFHVVLSEPAPAVREDGLQYSPFSLPSTQHEPKFLFKRQSCPSGHTSCSNLNAPDACCPSGTNCARDERNNIACCPINNVCTGTLGAGTPASSTSSAQDTSVRTTNLLSTITVTSTAGVAGTSASQQASITGSVAGGGSTIQDAYYPFVYLPTAFGNSAICSQYYTSCQSASTACFQSLAGVNGVTIGGMGGGTTQAGNSGIIQASASSICSSLSQRACYGLQTSQCAQFGSAGATGTVVQIGRGPRETGCPAMAYVAVVGVAAGAMGMVI